MGKRKDYQELILLSHDAQHAKEIAQAELHRFEQAVLEERNQRDREVLEKKMLVQQRVEMNQRLEMREKGTKDEVVVGTGGAGPAGSGRDVAVPADTKPAEAPSRASNEELARAQQRLSDYEEGYKKLREITGVGDVNEIIQKFMTLEVTHEHLVKETNDQQAQLDGLTAEYAKLTGQLNELKFSGGAVGGGTNAKKQAIEDVEGLLAESSSKLEKNRTRYEKLAAILIDVNAMIRAEMNLVRVWGGGWYGTDHFYDSADRHGILVWEELKLAGATYPESILESLQLEIQQQLQRIYSHPSLVILSGDNEVSLMLEQNWYGVTREELHRLMTEYRKQQEFIAGVVGGFNAHAHFHFVPSSSTVGIDTHYYDYTTDCTDWASFPNKTVLVSEYGYQSWCNEGCLSQSMTDPDVELDTPWTESPFLRTRQHRQNGNKEIWNQSVKLFPDLLKREFVTVREFVWTSQLTQAVCLRAATETFRRQATNQGVMYWQLNDVWPAASWSTVGFDGLYKPSFYSARTAMAEDMVSMYVDKDDLVVGVRLTTSATTINSFNMYIVNMRDGNVATITVDQQSELTPNVFNILKRVPLTEVCTDRTCVAAISPSNYILLGPIDRSLVRFDQNHIASSVRVIAESAKSFRLSVSIPTPFIHLNCENTNFDWNSLFLFPPLWDSTVVQSDKDCASPKVYHFWSFFPTPANHQPYVVVAE